MQANFCDINATVGFKKPQPKNCTISIINARVVNHTICGYLLFLREYDCECLEPLRAFLEIKTFL